MARISTITSPQYQSESSNMKKFRMTLDGGQKYIDTYLYLFSNYETAETFAFRKKFASVPQQAVTALNKIVDSITARMIDVKRTSPSAAYNLVAQGNGRGVDRRGSSMTTFIVRNILKELLAMKRVAVHIDREQLTTGSTSKAVTDVLTPYCNIYKCEEIRSWSYGEDGKLATILLQATKTKVDEETQLPNGTEKVYRLFSRKEDVVTFTEYDAKDVQISSLTLDLTEIPIVIFELNSSLLENIADMQITLMNYDNWDAILMRINFPMLTKQKKSNPFDIYSKRGVPPPAFKDNQSGLPDSVTQAATNSTAVPLPDSFVSRTPEVLSPDVIQTYDLGTERPNYISPPTTPLEVSMKKQEDITKRIYESLALYYRSVRGVYQSDSSRNDDQRNGLNAIAFELARGELEITRLFCMYDDIDSSKCSVLYPRDFDTRTDEERLKACDALSKLCDAVPSLTAKKAMLKTIVRHALTSHVDSTAISVIDGEIDALTLIVSTQAVLKDLLSTASLLPADAKLLFTGGK